MEHTTAVPMVEMMDVQQVGRTVAKMEWMLVSLVML